MKYTHLNIAVRRDTAEIHDLVDLALLGSVCLKKMISTGVFVLVVCALKRPISVDAEKPSMILVLGRHKRSRSTKNWVLRCYFLQREATDKQGPQPNEKNDFMTIFRSLDCKIERCCSETKEPP